MFSVLVAPTWKQSDSNLPAEGLACKAGNKKCFSLLPEAVKPEFPPSPCDICCTESRFCRDCCCILCCKTITFCRGDHSYIRCEAKVNHCYVCWHVAHVDCALRCCMAGAVDGINGLDSEYYCRRCDSRTDLLPHVKKLLQTCESIQSPDSVEHLLNIGVSILRGSQKNSSKTLLELIESAIWKVDLLSSATITMFPFFQLLPFLFPKFFLSFTFTFSVLKSFGMVFISA